MSAPISQSGSTTPPWPPRDDFHAPAPTYLRQKMMYWLSVKYRKFEVHAQIKDLKRKRDSEEAVEVSGGHEMKRSKSSDSAFSSSSAGSFASTSQSTVEEQELAELFPEVQGEYSPELQPLALEGPFCDGFHLPLFKK